LPILFVKQTSQTNSGHKRGTVRAAKEPLYKSLSLKATDPRLDGKNIILLNL